jgi:hypothetical protein
MNLAAILGIYLSLGCHSLGCQSVGWLPPAVRGLVPQSAGQPPAVTSPDSPAPPSQNSVPASQPQTPPTQGSEPTQPVPSPTGQTPSSPGQAKPAPKRRRHHKKNIPNCSTSPTPLNPAVGNPADSTNSAGAGSNNTGSTNPGSTDTGSTNTASANAGATNASTTALKPCAPPRKVVRNGGSAEPTVQLTGGGTTAEQAVHQRSTDQLNAATDENLKKIEGRQLSPNQQEMVSQIKQFRAQSRTALAAGDLERGHNLALKAHLLSDELVKP